MKKEEAIRILNEQAYLFYEDTYPYERIAYDMAIKSLSAEPNKSRPYGDCAKCIHEYGTLGCCTTVSNEWVYDCDNGMAQYEKTKEEPSEKPITKEMESVILRLKSGREFKFECTSYSIDLLKQDGSLCGFKYNGGVGECPIWFDVDDIEVIAIVSKGGDEE